MNNILISVCYHLMISNALSRITNMIGEDLGLSSSEIMLILILYFEDDYTLTQKELEHISCLPQTVANELCRRIESKGFVKREKSENDKRIRVVKLTDEGINVCKKLDKRYLSISNNFTKDINIDEVRYVAEFYEKSYNKVTNILNDPNAFDNLVK